MDFWKQLVATNERESIALVSLVETSGSTPRKPGTRMFLSASGIFCGTVGGGVAESICLDVCRRVLDGGASEVVDIDLRGNPVDVREGVCGGTMRLVVNRLEAGDHVDLFRRIISDLAQGIAVELTTTLDLETPLTIGASLIQPQWVDYVPPPLLAMIFGAGHIGRALAHRAHEVGFLPGICDDRPEWLDASAFPPGALIWRDIEEAISVAESWDGPLFVVLVTRGFQPDVAALAALSPYYDQIDYLGVLGSVRRIQTVRRECAVQGLPEWPAGKTFAPIGIEISAETPEEIAISIVAEMIRVRRSLQDVASKALVR